jgi:DNA polymerase-1
VSENFATIVVVDSEFETSGGDYDLRPGDLPVPLCLVAYVLDENLQHVRTIRMWREELLALTRPPFDVGPDALFVAYSSQAELTCFLALGWQFPEYIFDLHTAYLAVSNILLPYDPEEKRKRQRKRLPDACRAYGIAGWENIDKETIAKDIGEGRWRKYGVQVVLDYCEEDVSKSTELLRKQLRRHLVFPPADVERNLWWSNYSAKAVARIQARGMPIDVALWNLVQENKAAIVRDLVRRLDPSQGSDAPIYTPEGEWSYASLENWLASAGIDAWPRRESGRLDLEGDAFKLMYHIPGIEDLHALRDSLGVIARAKLPIGRDGRNRPSLFPFCTATGRNAHAKSLYNAHAGLRSFMVFPPDKIGVYLDWRTQEVGVAAALSGDPALTDAYRRGDVYHDLARVCCLTDDPDPKHWKATSPDQRQRMKSLQLAINYGMSVPSLAKGLDRHPLVASHIIEKHRQSYPRFWEWRANSVQRAMLDRRIETVFGWPLRITSSPNKRTLYNFPMQGNGAEMLRLAAWRLCEAGIIPCMLIHDGILLEARDQEEIDHVVEIMRAAGRDVCDGLEIGVDVDQKLEYGARYRDKRPVAKAMWATMMFTLQDIGAIPKGPLP